MAAKLNKNAMALRDHKKRSRFNVKRLPDFKVF
jgi:hypothetical protein